MKPCAVIPTYNHAKKLSQIVRDLESRDIPIIIVDDGSRSEIANQIAALASECTTVLRHTENQGKGKALVTGFRFALEAGFTHALQLDADGQHASHDVAEFLSVASVSPAALILGKPVFDASAPRARVWGRKLSVWLVWLETWSFAIADPLCGFRVYPLATTHSILEKCDVGHRMDFDPEIAVRAVWAGMPTINIPTKILYSDEEHSNFDYVRDNIRMISLHTRLLIERVFAVRR